MVFYILFQATLSFTFINAVVYVVDIYQGIHNYGSYFFYVDTEGGGGSEKCLFY